MNYKDLSEIISKPWINVNGIMKICNCERNTAIKTRQDVEKIIIDSGKIVPPSMTKYVPTRLVIEQIGLDEYYIFKMAARIV